MEFRCILKTKSIFIWSWSFLNYTQEFMLIHAAVIILSTKLSIVRITLFIDRKWSLFFYFDWVSFFYFLLYLLEVLLLLLFIMMIQNERKSQFKNYITRLTHSRLSIQFLPDQKKEEKHQICLGAFVPTVRHRYKNNELIHPWRFTIQVRDHMDQNVIAMIIAELFALCVCVMCSSLCLLYIKDIWKKRRETTYRYGEKRACDRGMRGKCLRLFDFKLNKKISRSIYIRFLLIPFRADRLPFIRFVRIETHSN